MQGDSILAELYTEIYLNGDLTLAEPLQNDSIVVKLYAQ